MGGTLTKCPEAIEVFLETKARFNKLSFGGEAIEQKVAVSNRRGGKKQKKLIQSLELKEVYCGGSGNKIAKVVRGETNCAMFIESPTSTWDSCAGEAIIVGMGGFFVKPDLSKIEYNWAKEDQMNNEGFICGLSCTLYDKFVVALS